MAAQKGAEGERQALARNVDLSDDGDTSVRRVSASASADLPRIRAFPALGEDDDWFTPLLPPPDAA